MVLVTIIEDSLKKYQSDIKFLTLNINDLIKSSQEDNPKSWKPLRVDSLDDDDKYPVIPLEIVATFRNYARETVLPVIRDNFPSLKDDDKPSPPDDWSPKSISLAKKEDS